MKLPTLSGIHAGRLMASLASAFLLGLFGVSLNDGTRATLVGKCGRPSVVNVEILLGPGDCEEIHKRVSLDIERLLGGL